MKKILSLFAIGAILLGMASCGDGNDPQESKVPEGAISGKFSIAQRKQVYFSQGNLQYQGTNNPNVPENWRFAINQWDFVGDNEIGTVYVGATKCSNIKVSKNYTGWIDLFGHGTSGYNDKFPYMIFQAESWYPTSIANNNYDWGRFCKIDNGGEKGVWRTLTLIEVEFLLKHRQDADQLFGFGKIKTEYGDVNGFILLPDNWEEVKPEALIFHSYSSLHQSRMPSYQIIDPYYKDNICTAQQWKDLFEPAGAVFLPAAGVRSASDDVTDGLESCNEYGTYWLSETTCQGWFDFEDTYWDYSKATDYQHLSSNYFSALHSVRLVQDVK